MTGYYQMQRGWMKHPIFKKEPMTEREAWMWLIEEARWKDTNEYIDGKWIMIKRGQLSHSIRYLAEAWGWNRRKAEMFINRLKNVTMIETVNGTKRQIINICNYERYQAPSEENGTVRGTENGTILGQSWDKIEEGKKERNKISDDECARDPEENVLDEIKNITKKLQEIFHTPHPFSMAPVASWIGWGANYELDIRPAAERYLAKKAAPPRSLTWLNEEIATSIRQRKSPMPEPSPPPSPKLSTPARRETREEWLARKRLEYASEGETTT